MGDRVVGGGAGQCQMRGGSGVGGRVLSYLLRGRGKGMIFN